MSLRQIIFGILLAAAFIGWTGIKPCTAQNLFLEECFTGGVMVAGRTSIGITDGSFEIHWNPNHILRKAYLLTYRYGNPKPTEFLFESLNLQWDVNNQFGNTLDDGEFTRTFAVHVQEISNQIEINDDEIYVYLDGADITESIPNQGFWGLLFVLLYEKETVVDEICFRAYTASQPQTEAQEYNISTPNFDQNMDFGFSIYSDRIGPSPVDRSIVGINGELLGNIGGVDGANPGSAPPFAGVRGHFYYENGELFGLDDDIPNNTVEDTDGIAVINEYLVNEDTQEFYFSPVNPDPDDRFNVHPAFFLTYTPDCDFLPDLSSMPRQYSYCRGESVTFEAVGGYDNYEWASTTGTIQGLTNPNTPNPICSSDTSRWYTVRMWNDDEEGCSQTIPVFVEVNTVPKPQSLNIRDSFCPQSTGRIEVVNTAGTGSFSYSLNGQSQSSPVFNNIAAGDYTLVVNSAQGCSWDTLVSVPLDPLQEAIFSPRPPSGFTPLEVFFNNQSTGATDYLWLIDGEEISNSEDLLFNFPDSGSFEISLIAYLNEETCADTAAYLLRVEQGIEIMMPNIISPNGDGRNDELVAIIKGVTSCRWFVYNRWGVELSAGASAPLSHLGSGMGTEDGVMELTLWNPSDEITEGAYSVVFVAEGIGGQLRELRFEVMVVR